MRLSVVLATYNEEENLKSCLESVADIADEIVIVDGSSTDKTREIAKSFNARIIIKDNPQIFHINKKIAIDNAKSDWILQLDADEQVTHNLKQEILNNIGKKEVDGFWIPRKNYFLGRFLTKGGQYPDFTLRLYRRGKGFLPAKDVHEQAVVKGKVEYLKNPLLHFADRNFSRYLKRFDRYTDLIAKQLSEDNKGKLIGVLPYFIFKPVYWFLLAYIRHKGFVDSWQGFVFAFFSALRYPVAYYKYLTKHANYSR